MAVFEFSVENFSGVRSYLAGLRRYLLDKVEYNHVTEVKYKGVRAHMAAPLNFNISGVPMARCGELNVVKHGGILKTSDFFIYDIIANS